ncbi:MAG: T9SS type A sorting domain-containing protein [Bacteroidota bacterium]|nr:T9SS type A sorting domain-containing protein [Bacteroidota bacterium]
MKTILIKSLFLLAILLSVSSKAQTSVNISYATDSAINYCPPPVNLTMNIGGVASGYNPSTDSIDVHYFWDDGTDTTVRVMIGLWAPDYFLSYGPHTYTSPGIYDIMVTTTGPDGSADTIFNTVTITSGCVAVDGYCFEDNNSNCVFDAGDDTLSGIPVSITNSMGNLIGYAYTDANGYYLTYVPTGLSGLQISPSTYWGSGYTAVTCPSTGSYTFNSFASASFNFGIGCISTSYDLYAHQSSGWVAPPGSNGHVSFYAGNASCISTPSTITLILDPSVSYAGMFYGPVPTTIAGNTLTWNTTLIPTSYYYGGFWVDVNIFTNVTATIFDTACFDLSISPTVADLNVSNNAEIFCRVIGGPYDPNNKEVSPAGIGANGNIAPDTELTYTINFQNTGTAPAINVYVMDTISTNLDMSTFRIEASSHAMNPYFYEGNIVRFDYPSIMLPDSNANEPLSHGWVVYKIKTKSGLSNGTQIKNTGHIFFDYNSAIVTNTTLNTIDISMGIEENINTINTNIFPNPATDRISIQFGEAVSGTLSLVDMTGRVVRSQSINHSEQASFNLEGLSSGLYGITLPGVQLKQTRVQVIR